MPSKLVNLSILSRKKNKAGEREERKSFGIGGAGNIRTREQAVIHDAHDLVERRRSRMSSSASAESPAKMNTARRSSSISETLKHVFTNSSR
ncbi:hypothetical protein F5Y14DRAFT_419839 [Nemania sp. NC0429]|nr:hypothetical protein F5Y14DRAFT_419839 [Nemania sp. NC0429]